MSRYFLRYTLALAVALPWAASAQLNSPLTGGSASQPAAVAVPVAPAAQAMPDRPVVRQVQTPMPAVAAQASQASAPVTSAPVASAPASAPAPERANGMGDVTRGLLAAQADGRRAGGALPILGPVSTASWNRYLESFRQPIPQWFTERVSTDSE